MQRCNLVNNTAHGSATLEANEPLDDDALSYSYSYEDETCSDSCVDFPADCDDAYEMIYGEDGCASSCTTSVKEEFLDMLGCVHPSAAPTDSGGFRPSAHPSVSPTSGP